MSADLAGRLRPFLRNDADAGSRHRIRTILEFLDIAPGERVFDCGSGLGWILKIVGELYDCRLVGLDVDRSRIERARRELGGRTSLVGGTIESLPFASRAFDKIILSEVLEHVADDAAGLREVVRVLRPGGVLAITVPNRDYPFWWDPVNWSRESLKLAPITRGVFGGIWTNHLRLYGRSEITDLVRRSGLDVEAVAGLVHRCLPFAHNLVYGIGKPLVESGLLRDADRFRYARRRDSALRPLTWVFRLVDYVDRRNPGPVPEGQSAVCLALKARKPG